MLPSGEVELQENLEVSFSTRNNLSNCIAALTLEMKGLYDPEYKFLQRNSFSKIVNREVI